MASNAILLITLALFNFIYVSFTFDTCPLLDFCVAIPTGNACKDPETVIADDFFLSGLDRPRNINLYALAFVIATANTVLGFNTLGLTFVRVEFARNGYFPPHTHLRVSETFYIAKGMIEIGFVTTYPGYKYYNKVLNKGDVFIAPIGLVHTVRNVAKTKSVMLAAFNSQNPGFIFMPDNVFAAKPAINTTYLAGAFKLDEYIVKVLQTKP